MTSDINRIGILTGDTAGEALAAADRAMYEHKMARKQAARD